MLQSIDHSNSKTNCAAISWGSKCLIVKTTVVLQVVGKLLEQFFANHSYIHRIHLGISSGKNVDRLSGWTNLSYYDRQAYRFNKTHLIWMIKVQSYIYLCRTLVTLITIEGIGSAP